MPNSLSLLLIKVSKGTSFLRCGGELIKDLDVKNKKVSCMTSPIVVIGL